MPKTKTILCVILVLVLSSITTRGITVLNQKPVILGDVNSDSKIDSIDLLMVQRHILKIDKLSKIERVRADMNMDNIITIVDLAKIQKYIRGE